VSAEPRPAERPAATGSPRDFAEYGAIVVPSLWFDPSRPLDDWFDRVGRENFRFAHAAGQVAGGLAIYRAGQYFGGRRLECGAIAAVAVAPEHRGSGIGSRLMRDAVGELRAGGTPLACLFPATLPVYRNAGFESAGLHCRFKIPTAALDVRATDLQVRRAGLADRDRFAALYAEQARRTDGWLDRPAVLWMRNLAPWTGEHFCYLVEGGEGPEGYVVYAQENEGGKRQIRVLDCVAGTPRAAARLLSFFAAHRSLAHVLDFPDAPALPFLAPLADPPVEVARFLRWMLRLCDVRAALEQRGYRPGVTGEVHLAVRDAVLPENAGRLILEVADGCGRVSPGGRGDLSIDVRGLAALFTGFQTTRDLAQAGLAAAEHRGADALFAGGPAWMPDMF